MTKKTKALITAAAGIFAAAAIISLFMNIHSKNDEPRNIAGQAVKSAVSVTINGVDIPSYDFQNELYVLADNLIYFGSKVEPDETGASLTISLPQENITEGMDISASIIRTSDTIDVYYPDYITYINGQSISSWAADAGTLIPRAALAMLGAESIDESTGAYSYSFGGYEPPASTAENAAENADADNSIVIVLDPGHGKSSDLMSDDEKAASGWINSGNGWGEWRHFKYGTSGPDCEGEDCSHRVTPNGACWYPIENGDRDTEPEINLNNCLAAKTYLEQMGYTVRLTRTTNDENPSITRRLSCCYPNGDTSLEPDADIFLCIHSNAGGGSGSSYISLEGPYDQPNTLGSSDAYAAAGNALGQYINDEIGSRTLLGTNEPIASEPELIAFCKCPVVCGYMEIGFFDNPADNELLNSSPDAIGSAIAAGTDKFIREYLNAQ